MPNFDLTITISAIVAVSAVISPIFTTIINNHYQLKLKKIELKQKEYEQTILYKRNILENYIRYLNGVYQYPNNESLSNYAQYYSLAYAYLPENTRKKISDINHRLGQSAHANIVNEIDEIISDISDILQKL